MDYSSKDFQQVCHFLKSIMSPEQETLATEFQWRKVCHKHSTTIHALAGVNTPPLIMFRDRVIYRT